MVMTCAKCGSDRIVPNAKLFDQGKHSDGTIKAAFEKNPQAWLFKGRVLCKVRAVICGDCGFTELYTENSRVIYEAHQPMPYCLGQRPCPWSGEDRSTILTLAVYKMTGYIVNYVSQESCGTSVERDSRQ